MVYRWPASLIRYMELRIQNFVWTGSMVKKKFVTISLDACCWSKKEGSFGIRNLRIPNEALLLKLAASIDSTSNRTLFF